MGQSIGTGWVCDKESEITLLVKGTYMIIKLDVPDHLVSPLVGLLRRDSLPHLGRQFGSRNVIDANKIKLHLFDLLEDKIRDYQI